MKVLFIGGTGIISSACTELAARQGIDLHLLSRGNSHRPIPDGVTVLRGDINDSASVLDGHTWDAVVDWIVYTPDQIERDIEFFRGKTSQYVFISSASAYQTPPSRLPVLESTPLDNPYWEYSRQKAACEERLTRAYREEKFPVTFVRPSHTYDKTLLPFDNGYTVLHRILNGLPVCVHGDGTSLWTLTHHADFAKGFNGLLGYSGAIGESVHITSDEWLTWNQIYDLHAHAASRLTGRAIVAEKRYLPSSKIAEIDPGRRGGLLGDKANSMVFDNSKIKAMVPGFACTTPFSRGVMEIVGHYLQNPGTVDPDRMAMEDRLCALASG